MLNSRYRIFPLLVLIVLGSYYFAIAAVLPAYAQGTPTPTQVNRDFSRIYIFVDKSGVVGHSHAIEGKIAEGKLSFRLGNQGKLVFDMTSFDADTPRARQYIGLEGTTDDSTRSKVNSNMLGAEVLDIKKFPTAKIENVSIQAKTGRSSRDLPEYLLAGDFTLRGKTRRIESICDLELKDGWYHLRGDFKIRQSEFEMKPFSKMLGTIGVADELVIYGDLWIVPE